MIAVAGLAGWIYERGDSESLWYTTHVFAIRALNDNKDVEEDRYRNVRGSGCYYAILITHPTPPAESGRQVVEVGLPSSLAVYLAFWPFHLGSRHVICNFPVD